VLARVADGGMSVAPGGAVAAAIAS
jgi:hypothetical protein